MSNKLHFLGQEKRKKKKNEKKNEHKIRGYPVSMRRCTRRRASPSRAMIRPRHDTHASPYLYGETRDGGDEKHVENLEGEEPGQGLHLDPALRQHALKGLRVFEVPRD